MNSIKKLTIIIFLSLITLFFSIFSIIYLYNEKLINTSKSTIFDKSVIVKMNSEGEIIKNDITYTRLKELLNNSNINQTSNIDLYDNFNSVLYSKCNCIINGENNRIIYGNNIYEPMANASTTKIMTCIIAIENGDLEDEVTVSEYAASMPDVQLNIKAGDKYKLYDLLYSLMLESHNDTAVAIAEHIGGSVEGFAALMNNKAKEIGCVNTHFVTPNGLDNELHYSCAYDLCLIAKYALSNDTFVKIINTKSITITDTTKTKHFELSNHNAFLDMYDGAYGVKTGYTSKAGYCFVGAVNSNGNNYISTVLASGWPPHKNYKWEDTKKLMSYAIDNCLDYKSIDKNTMKSCVNTILKDISINYKNIDFDYKSEKYTISNKSNIKYYVLLKDEYDYESENIIGEIFLFDSDHLIDLFTFEENHICNKLKYKDYIKKITKCYF